MILDRRLPWPVTCRSKIINWPKEAAMLVPRRPQNPGEWHPARTRGGLDEPVMSDRALR